MNNRVNSAIRNISELGIESKKSKNIEILEEYEIEENDEENESE